MYSILECLCRTYRKHRRGNWSEDPLLSQRNTFSQNKFLSEGENFLLHPLSSIDKTIMITFRPEQPEVKRHFPL